MVDQVDTARGNVEINRPAGGYRKNLSVQGARDRDINARYRDIDASRADSVTTARAWLIGTATPGHQHHAYFP